MVDGMIAGLVSGSAYAILGVCLVVLYRLVGVLNFSQAAIGALGAYTCYAAVGAGLPLGLAVLGGLGASGVVAGFAGWVLSRWFSDPTATVRSVVSVVLLIVLLTLGFRLFGDAPRIMPSLVSDRSFAIAGVRVSLSTFIALCAALVIAAGLSLLLHHTRVGLRLQAMAERPTSVQLLGINSRTLTVGVWAVTGALSTLALLLIAPTGNPTFQSMSMLVVPALAAGLLGAFANVWVAAAGGLMIGGLEGIGSRVPLIVEYRGAIPFAIIILALVWFRRRAVWDASH